MNDQHEKPDHAFADVSAQRVALVYAEAFLNAAEQEG